MERKLRAKKKIGFFKKEQGIFTKNFIEEIKRGLISQNIEVVSGIDYKKMYIKNGKVFFNKQNLSDLDVYFWHDIVDTKIWQGDNYYLNNLKVLEKTCNVVNSSDSTRIVNDKFASHQILKESNLPVADFALVNLTNRSAIEDIYETLGESVLIKPRFRGFGMGIVKVDSKEHLLEILELLQSYIKGGEQQVLIEKFYENDISKWISVVVFGDKVLFGYRKKILGESDWKVYDPERKDARGQYTEYVEPSEELKQIALKAKNAIGKDIICFDFIYTKEGYKIIDENGRPGLYENCLEKGNINIKEELINLIKSKLNE